MMDDSMPRHWMLGSILGQNAGMLWSGDRKKVQEMSWAGRGNATSSLLWKPIMLPLP